MMAKVEIPIQVNIPVDVDKLIEFLKKDGTLVAVVRCKECKYKPHWDEKTESAVFPIPDRCPCECDDYFYSWVPNDDWFCKDGKRKDGAE